MRRKTDVGVDEGSKEEWQKPRACIAMVTDCKSLCAVICGHEVLREPVLHDLLSKTLGRIDTMLNQGWAINKVGGDPWQWRPRELNKAPDAICNLVMDHRCDFFKDKS